MVATKSTQGGVVSPPAYYYITLQATALVVTLPAVVQNDVAPVVLPLRELREETLELRGVLLEALAHLLVRGRFNLGSEL